MDRIKDVVIQNLPDGQIQLEVGQGCLSNLWRMEGGDIRSPCDWTDRFTGPSGLR